MAKYLGLFVSEASEHLASLSAELVRLEAAARDGGETAAVVDEIFRHVHSVKGMSASLELDGIARLAHAAEDVVGATRISRGLDGAGVDALLAAVDGLTAMVERVRAGERSAPDPALLERLAAVAASRRDGAHADGAGSRLGSARSAEALVHAAEAAPERRPAPASPRRLAVEVDVAPACPVPAVRGYLVVKKLERLGSVIRCTPSLDELRAGYLPGARLLVALETTQAVGEVERTLSQISELQQVAVRDTSALPLLPADTSTVATATGAAAARDERSGGGRTVRVRVELLDAFLDTVGELILATARLREIGRGIPEDHRPALDEGVDRLHATVKDLHEQVMSVRMTPLAAVTARLPRAARDLARRTGKLVAIAIRGAEIEIDRAILDELSDPLVHVLRNAVDHGIEAPERRQLAGKPATGRITVTARRERDRVLVEMADDGKGMDVRALRDAAVARGVMTEGEAQALTDREALLLACLPGISTAEQLTELSGRGVGMDAVKRTVEALGGALEVDSAPGVGTRWTFRLPLTVAVQPVLLVGVGGEVLGLPVAKVHGAAQVDLDSLERSEGAPMLLVDGKLVPVKDLGQLLGFGGAAAGPLSSVVITDAGGVRVGFVVDLLLGQQDAVLKPLLRPFDRVPGLSAVTVLASGRPVFILDVLRLGAA